MCEGSDLLQDSQPLLVARDGTEPDCWLQCEVILQAQLHDQALEPHDPPDPAEPSEMARDGVWSAPLTILVVYPTQHFSQGP